MVAQSGAVEVYLMVEQLQQEVRELRGMVEQQAYTIEQLKNQQRERYVDLDQRMVSLDKRLAELGSGASTPPAGAPANANPPAAGGTVPPAASQNTQGAGPSAQAAATRPNEANEDIAASKVPVSDAQRRAYQQAYELIRQRQYDKAVDALHGFISQYPNTDLTANAYYWLGEVYLVMPKMEQAKQAFTVVISRYPNHRKSSDAYYKLGVVHDRLGDKARAREYLDSTVKRFPNTSAANLAQDYLRKL
jgi:tol-pal system protein YbgF